MNGSFSPAAMAFDLDGTVYLADEPLVGAVELISHLREQQIPYLFATNNSSIPTARYVERLNAMHIPADRSEVVTSNDVAIADLTANGMDRVFLLATQEVRAEYAANGISHGEDGAQAVVLTFDLTLDYQKLVVASSLLRRGLPYFATHLDLVCPTPQGPVPDAGSFNALLGAATGREPRVFGKPSAAMATTIRQRLTARLAERDSANRDQVGRHLDVRDPDGRDLAGRDPYGRDHADNDTIAFVGDRLYTDVRMANDHGFTAVLTLTGEATREELAQGPYRADVVVRDLAELRDLLLTAPGAHLRDEVRH